MADSVFIEEAIRRAAAAGFAPEADQRPVEWELVQEWANRVQRPGFRWLQSSEQPRYGGSDIVVSANGAICSGQHRILGGLMGGHPVPEESISRLSADLDTKPWG